MNLWSHVFIQPHNQKLIHSDAMHLFYDNSPASMLKSNAILRTDEINDLSPRYGLRLEHRRHIQTVPRDAQGDASTCARALGGGDRSTARGGQRGHAADNEAKRAALKGEWLKLSRILANMRNRKGKLVPRWVTV